MVRVHLREVVVQPKVERRGEVRGLDAHTRGKNRRRQAPPQQVLSSAQRQATVAGKDNQRQRQAEIEKEGEKQREGSANFINAGT